MKLLKTILFAMIPALANSSDVKLDVDHSYEFQGAALQDELGLLEGQVIIDPSSLAHFLSALNGLDQNSPASEILKNLSDLANLSFPRLWGDGFNDWYSKISKWAIDLMSTLSSSYAYAKEQKSDHFDNEFLSKYLDDVDSLQKQLAAFDISAQLEKYTTELSQNGEEIGNDMMSSEEIEAPVPDRDEDEENTIDDIEENIPLE